MKKRHCLQKRKLVVSLRGDTMRMVVGKKDIEEEHVPSEEIKPAPDTYRSRILKYIPAEVIALYDA